MTTCFTKDIPIDYSEAELQTLINAELHDFPTKYSSYEKSMDIYLTSNKPGEHHANNSRPGCDEQHNKRTAEDFVREFSDRMYQMWMSTEDVDIYAVDMLQYHLSTMFPEYTDIIERIMNTKRNTSVNRVRKKMKTSGSTTPPSSDMYSAQIIENTAKILHTMISQFDLWCQKNKNNTYTKTAHDILCSHEFKHLFNEFKTIFLLDM
ncbi:hypothetical protein M9434_004536 [Picochlorum sp. BPE23]|nr:hypothetical protein M9434_004536 [Picochlorum sp. BPE23]